LSTSPQSSGSPRPPGSVSSPSPRSPMSGSGTFRG
jgi:hypothetical protein